MAGAGRGLTGISIEFGEEEWREEVERFRRHAPARVQAQRARLAIETGARHLDWRRCRAEGEDGTRLPHCLKLYVPLDRPGTSESPFGFVFELQRTPDNRLILDFLAFGERHPSPAQGQFKTPSVYDRAHKRLHGRYP